MGRRDEGTDIGEMYHIVFLSEVSKLDGIFSLISCIIVAPCIAAGCNGAWIHSIRKLEKSHVAGEKS